MDTPENRVFPTEGSLRRQDFPTDFIFGASTSAFQSEGAADMDGSSPSIWDTFLIDRHPEIVQAGGLDASARYRQYEDDVRVMKEMGLDAYRFSISWSRILPSGRRANGAGVNKKGMAKSGAMAGVNKKGMAKSGAMAGVDKSALSEEWEKLRLSLF